MRCKLGPVSRKCVGFLHCLTALYIKYLSLEECLTLRHQMIRRFFLICSSIFFFLFATAARAIVSQKMELSDGVYFVEEKKSMPI